MRSLVVLLVLLSVTAFVFAGGKVVTAGGQEVPDELRTVAERGRSRERDASPSRGAERKSRSRSGSRTSPVRRAESSSSIAASSGSASGGAKLFDAILILTHSNAIITKMMVKQMQNAFGLTASVFDAKGVNNFNAALEVGKKKTLLVLEGNFGNPGSSDISPTITDILFKYPYPAILYTATEHFGETQDMKELLASRQHTYYLAKADFGKQLKQTAAKAQSAFK
ncbi:rpoC [Acrasis kona]|uniref:RpoC n=1 Tax=Acrasis kona TaxID=1008807 RepID=A0AAW2ZPL0_9EUKA